MPCRSPVNSTIATLSPAFMVASPYRHARSIPISPRTSGITLSSDPNLLMAIPTRNNAGTSTRSSGLM